MLQGKNQKIRQRMPNAPYWFLICEKDNRVSPDKYKSVAKILGEKATVLKYPVGHFENYHGECWY